MSEPAVVTMEAAGEPRRAGEAAEDAETAPQRDSAQSDPSDKFGDFVLINARYEAVQLSCDVKIEKMKADMSSVEEKYNGCKMSLELAEDKVKRLEEELRATQSDLKDARDSLSIQKIDADNFCLQRDSALEVRNSLSKMVEVSNNEIESLKSTIDSLRSQLETDFKDRCEIMNKSKLLDSKILMVDYKASHLEQEKLGQDKLIQTLRNDLDKCYVELHTSKTNFASMKVNFERQLSKKIDEINMAQSNLSNLNATKRELNLQIDELKKITSERAEKEEKMQNDYQAKLTSKTKLAELYKAGQEESNVKYENLLKNFADLKKITTESTERIEQLESELKITNGQHQEEIQQKDKVIKALERELQNANNFLRMANEDLDSTMEGLSPSANVALKFIKSKLSLTKAYDELVRLTEELDTEKNENKKLRSTLMSIVGELEGKTPYFTQQEKLYEEAVENNNLNMERLETAISDIAKNREEKSELDKMYKRLQRENATLKEDMGDLSRQICILLKEIDSRKVTNLSNDEKYITLNGSQELNASHVIDNNLVTFKNIQELQANNQQLVRLVRDLSEKKEKNEQLMNDVEDKDQQNRLETLKNRVAELTAAQDRQVKMINKLVKELDAYKKMRVQKSNDSSMCVDKMDDSLENVTNKSDFSKDLSNKIRCLELIEQELNEKKIELNREKENHRLTLDKCRDRELQLMGENESFRLKLRELQVKYDHSMASLESGGVKMNFLEMQLNLCKKEMVTLNEKIKLYASQIGKHGSINKNLSDELTNSREKLSKAHSLINALQLECKLAKQTANTSSNKRFVQNESQLSLIKNIERIKHAMLGDSDSVEKIQSTMDEALRMCTTLRCMLQEEQEKYNNIVSHLHQEINNHKANLMEEKGNVEKLTLELANAQKEVRLKSALIEDFSKNNPDTNYNAEITATSYVIEAVRNNDNNVSELKDQIRKLQSQLKVSENYVEQYTNMNKTSNNEFEMLNESFNSYKEANEIKMQELQQSEQSLKQKCIALEEKLSLYTKSIEDSNAKINILNLEVSEKNCKIEKLIANISEVNENIVSTDNKYEHAIIPHTKDCQKLADIKDELLRTNLLLDSVTRERDDLMHKLDQRSECEIHTLKAEIESFNTQLQNNIEQNAALRDQINASYYNSSLFQNLQQSESIATDLDINTSDLPENLTNLNHYLDEHNRINFVKYKLMQAENNRLNTQLESTELELDTKQNINFEEVGARHAFIEQSEIIRKVEELNSMLDCNSTLRKEKINLLNKIAELTESNKELKNVAELLQGTNKDLVGKVAVMENKNEDYIKEVEKWKNRVTMLIDQDEQRYPDDWKKIQNEHENLNNLLGAEKENSRKVLEEMEKLKVDKILMEEQIEKLQQKVVLFEKKMIGLSVTKVAMDKIQTELTNTKNMLDQKSTEHTQVAEKLASNETVLAEIKNKEFQLRKIAKRYKTQYEEFLVTSEEEKQKSAALVAEITATSERRLEALKELEQKHLELEKNHAEKLVELNKQINAYINENKKLLVEISTLKSSLQEKEERCQKTVKQAMAKIQLLTESRETLTKELKGQKDLYEQNSDENDVRMQAIKSQYDGHLSKLEKEKAQSLQEKQTEINNLNRQIESLMLKLNQMQRKVDQQAPKPSTTLNQGDKLTTDTPTANIKPLAVNYNIKDVASPRDGNRRVAGETPLASIKPMASTIRTPAALPPTAQVQGIVHQAPHTTGSVAGDMSSTPTSSHHATEFLPSSSSVGARLHQAHSRHLTVPPPESTQDIDTELPENSDMSTGAVGSQAVPQSAGLSQVSPLQAVALVMPRMESTSEMQTSHMHQQQASSSSGGNSSSTVTTSHGPSNSGTSNTNKGEILRTFKRPRVGSAQPQQKTILKRARTQGFQRVTDSEADYQVPTSSLRDQEDDVNFPDSEDDDTFQERIYDLEDENDADEEKDTLTRDLRIVEEAIGDNVSRSNEAEFANSQDAQSVRGDDGRPSNVETHSAERPALLSNLSSSQLQEQQIETISSGNGIDSGFLMLGAGSSGGVTSAVVSGAYEYGDDSIVPSTPTLYVPARNDGFGEAVRSPMSSRGLASNEARFTFNESGAGTTSGVMEDTHPDLAPQLTPHNRAPSDEANIAASADDNVAALESSEVEVEGSTSDGNTVDDETSAVSSQSSSFTLEEGREAEASTTAGIVSPSRGGFTHRGMKPTRRGAAVIHIGTPRPTDHPRIVWNPDSNIRRSFSSIHRTRGNRHIRRPPPFFKRF